MSEPLVRMARISKSYGSVKALTDVSLEVREREIVGLLGDNGAGKSTLIKILSGAIPATSGDIFIRGRQGRDPQHDRRDRQRHRDDLPGLGPGHAALDRAQPVPRPRAGEGAGLPQPHGPGDHEPGGGRAAAPGRHLQEHPADHAHRLALGRRAPVGRDRPGDVLRQRPDHPRRAHQQSRRGRDPGRAPVRPQRPRTPATPASSSPTTSTTCSRWWTASSSCAAARWRPTTSTRSARRSRRSSG